MNLPPEHLVDLAESLRHARYDGAFWSVNCEQMNMNLMRLSTGVAIPAHVNSELDVLMAFFEGEGELQVGDSAYPLGPGIVVVVPRGAMRALRCLRGPLVYLTAHKQRGGLMPI